MANGDLTPESAALRERAVQRLKKQRDFRTHLFVYLLVNGFVVLIWAMTDSGGFFWPAFPIGFWGIGLLLNGWDAYRHEEFSEADIQKEMNRLVRR